jgi:hypothetical protein
MSAQLLNFRHGISQRGPYFVVVGTNPDKIGPKRLQSQFDHDPDRRSARKYYSMSGHPGQYQYGALAGNYGRHDLDIERGRAGQNLPGCLQV